MLDEYLTLRNIEGISQGWHRQVNLLLLDYLGFVKWTVNKQQTLEYKQKLKDKYNVCSYRKKVYQIRKFLEFLSFEWTVQIILPNEPTYIPKHITLENIRETLKHF